MTASAVVSARSRRRFARRVWRRRLAVTRLLVPSLLVVGILAAAAWVVLGSPLLAVRTVEVRGATPIAGTVGGGGLDAAAVRRVAAGVVGRPMLRADLGAVRAGVAALPGVRDVRVSRSWPGTVVVTVAARTPAALRRDGGAWTVLDRDGAVLGAAARPRPALPVVETAARAAPGGGAVAAGLGVLDRLPPAVRAQVQAVRVADGPGGRPGSGAVALALDRRRLVVWGIPGDAAAEAARARVLAALLTRPAVRYDVSAPDAPTTAAR